MSARDTSTRRTGQVRTGGRAAEVVERVLRATVEELGRVGYAAMRVADVAARAGVNKTSIYRRWPSKTSLVEAAIAQISQRRAPIDTGSLRGDLTASLMTALTLGPIEQGLMRVLLMEHANPDIGHITGRLQDELRQTRVTMVERAVARGELPTNVDAGLIADLVSAPVQRALIFKKPIDETYIKRVLDVVLAGAAAQR